MHRTIKYQHKIINALDRDGLPSTYLCFNLLKLMFREHNRYFSIDDLQALLAAKKEDVNLICNSLIAEDFIIRHSEIACKYKYNLNCQQETRQCHFECYLAEVEANSIPLHEYLPYSPSAT